MYAHKHMLVVIIGMISLSFGFFMDLDHKGTFKDKWDCFTKPGSVGDEKLCRGIFHDPTVAASIIIFCLGIATSYSIHLMMNYLVS